MWVRGRGVWGGQRAVGSSSPETVTPLRCTFDTTYGTRLHLYGTHSSGSGRCARTAQSCKPC